MPSLSHFFSTSLFAYCSAAPFLSNWLAQDQIHFITYFIRLAECKKDFLYALCSLIIHQQPYITLLTCIYLKYLLSKVEACLKVNIYIYVLILYQETEMTEITSETVANFQVLRFLNLSKGLLRIQDNRTDSIADTMCIDSKILK